jgi:pentose-5-phosphate-3-epimerase
MIAQHKDIVAEREKSLEFRKKQHLPMRPMEIYHEAINQWGEDAQLNMVIEECSELIHAIQKFRRDKAERRVEDLVGEVADVGIMLDQVEEIMVLKYGISSFPQRVAQKRHEKLERLQTMLRKNEEVDEMPLHTT